MTAKKPITWAPRSGHGIPAQRPVASGELVAIVDWPAYKARHGLRIVRGEWRPTDKYPRLIVEFVEPQPERAEP